MSDCLMYWKFFWSDVKEDPTVANHHYYTAQRRFFTQVKVGDSLWVVVSGGPHRPAEWRLLQRIVVRTLKREKGVERPYHAVGNAGRTEMYDVSSQRDLEPLLHKLEFVTGRKITASGRLIGRSLQAIRPLLDDDTRLLERYARTLRRV